MNREPIQLDTLTWTQLNDAARARLAPDSKGQWTYHSPVDPGVTVLELMSWLLDQRVYRLDLVEEPLARAMLGLFGIEPRGTQSARMPVLMRGPGLKTPPAGVVPAGAALTLVDSDPPMVFATQEARFVLPVRDQDLRVRVGSGPERRASGLQAHPMSLLPVAGTDLMVQLQIPFDAAPASPDAVPFGILMILDAAGDPPPQWAPDAANVPPPAALSWSARWKSGGDWAPLAGLLDGTGGLRRSGIVSFQLPLGSPSAVDSLMVRIEAASPAFSSPPALRAIYTNAVLAVHSSWMNFKDTLEGPPLPGRVVEIPQTDEPPMEQDATLKLLERVSGSVSNWFDWTVKPSLVQAAPDERVFVVNRAARTITFGDGEEGRIPRVHESVANVEVQVRIGGGRRGNVAAGRTWTFDSVSNVLAINPAPALGGAEAETLDEAQARLRDELFSRQRIVTGDDAVEIAKSTPGRLVSRAKAAVGWHPAFPCRVTPGAMTIFVVPPAPRVSEEDRHRSPTPVSDPGALASIDARVQGARLLGSEVFVRPALYAPLAVEIRIAGAAAELGELRDDVTAALGGYLDPLLGGTDGTGWVFGEAVRPALLRRIVIETLADRATVCELRLGLWESNERTACNDLDIGPNRLPFLRELRMSAARSCAATGGSA